MDLSGRRPSLLLAIALLYPGCGASDPLVPIDPDDGSGLPVSQIVHPPVKFTAA